jgi:pyridoxal phosphate-dependent aminotransferase EpsN
MGQRERELLLEAYDSNWIAPLGPHVDAFEAEFCERIGTGHAAALSSGTAALHLALELVGVGPGDEVLLSDLTFAATVNAVVYRGATPVLIDAEPGSWCIDPDLLEEELIACDRRGRLPGAVIPVDLYGQCADYDRILAICARWEIPVIEDAAEALGATHRGRQAGSLGTLGAFSFNGNKIITTSGGGMLVSERGDWIERARFLASQARDPAPHYEHSTVGYNYRLSNLLAAVGRGQLGVLDERVARKREIRQRYVDELGREPGVTFMPEAAWGEATFWLTCVLIDPAVYGTDRETIRAHLETHDIESRPLWKPMHLQPIFEQCRRRGGDCSEHLFERGLCLPSGTGMGEAELARVFEAIRSAPRRR